MHCVCTYIIIAKLHTCLPFPPRHPNNEVYNINVFVARLNLNYFNFNFGLINNFQLRKQRNLIYNTRSI